MQARFGVLVFLSLSLSFITGLIFLTDSGRKQGFMSDLLCVIPGVNSEKKEIKKEIEKKEIKKENKKGSEKKENKKESELKDSEKVNNKKDEIRKEEKEEENK